MTLPLHVLILEDQSADAELMVYELRRAGFEPDWRRVDTEADYLASLESTPDIILSDYSLPQWDAPQALRALQDRDLDIPFIMISGTVGEDVAVACIKQGAADYLLKDRMTRLGQAVTRALEEKRLRDEKQRTEHALRTSDLKFRRFVEESSEGIVLTNEQGMITEWNRSQEQITGLVRADMLGQPLWEVQGRLMSDARRSEISLTFLKDMLLGFVRTGQASWGSRVMETEIQRADGTIRSVQTVVFPIPTDSGYIGASVLRDITERKQAERALQEQHRFNVTVLSSLSSHIAVLDKDGTIRAVNEAWTRFARENGASEAVSAGVGINYLEACRAATGADAETTQQSLAGIQAVSSGTIPEYELEYACHSPTVQRWFLMRVTPLSDSQGGVVASYTDITQRKQAEIAEHEQRTLAEALLDSALAITSSLDLTIVMRRLLQNLRKVIPYQSANIMLIEGDVTRPVAWEGYRADAAQFLETFVFSLDTPNLRELLMTRAPLIIPDTSQYPGWLARSETTVTRCYAGVPILAHGEVIGFLSMDSELPGFFTARQSQLQAAFAGQAAIAIENAQLYDRLQHHAQELARQVDVRTAELQRAKEHVEAILNSSSDGIILAGVNRGIQQTNPAFNALFACSPDDYLNVPLPALVAPVDAPKMETGLMAATQGAVNRVEIHAQRRDGTVFEAEMGLSPVTNNQAAVEKIVCILHDITERKRVQEALRESEERFRLLLDGAPIATVISDRMGRIVLVNRQAEALFGYDRTEMIGQMVAMLMPEYARAQHTQLQGSSLSAPRIRLLEVDADLRAKHKDDHEFPVEIQLSSLETDDEMLIMSFIVDITARKQTEAALQQALATEKELGKLKTQFVSMASHEFRTPLATILATSDTLTAYRHRMTEEQIEQKLVKIKEQVGYLKNVMDDVLLLARMQARRTEFTPERLNVDMLCRSVIEEFQLRPDVQHQIVYSVDGPVQEARLDKKLMRQIIGNLLSNAIKYSSPDKPVAIQLRTTPEAVEFKVSDQGIGIPESDQKHLFEPFHRADNVGNISGTGLGLAIVKDSVDMHGGMIIFESQVDVGTTFSVHIPLAIERNYSDDNYSGH